MGDRTTVIYIVQSKHKKAIEEYLTTKETNWKDFFKWCYIEEGTSLMEFTYEEVNYAEEYDFEEMVRDLKLPYNKSWDQGCTYPAGEGFIRWEDGKQIHIEISEYDRTTLLGICQEVLNTTPEDHPLRQYKDIKEGIKLLDYKLRPLEKE